MIRIVLALALATAACVGPDDGPGGALVPHVREPQLHVRVPPEFETLAQCEIARENDFFINCNQRIELCPDGAFFMMLFDSPNAGSYAIVEGQIQVTFSGAPSLSFQIGAGWSLTSPELGARPFLRDLDGAFEFGCSGGGGLDAGGGGLDAPF